MKRIFVSIFLVLALSLALASCTGIFSYYNTYHAASESTKSIRQLLNSQEISLRRQVSDLRTAVSSYMVASTINSNSTNFYDNACKYYDETLDCMKDMIDFYNKNSNCFRESTRQSIYELEMIYHSSLRESEAVGKQNRKEYIQIAKALSERIDSWEYVATV